MAGPVFQLLIYSCVTLNNLDGTLASKTCRWDQRSLYDTNAACAVAGRGYVGHPVFETDEWRLIEQTRCVALSVLSGDSK